MHWACLSFGVDSVGSVAFGGQVQLTNLSGAWSKSEAAEGKVYLRRYHRFGQSIRTFFSVPASCFPVTVLGKSDMTPCDLECCVRTRQASNCFFNGLLCGELVVWQLRTTEKDHCVKACHYFFPTGSRIHPSPMTADSEFGLVMFIDFWNQRRVSKCRKQGADCLKKRKSQINLFHAKVFQFWDRFKCHTISPFTYSNAHLLHWLDLMRVWSHLRAVDIALTGNGL